MSSHADSHDRDKLARYHQALTAPAGGQFPVYTIFLVSPQDHRAHNIFRQFRSSFEERSAGFEHLTIFGQHGTSTTVTSLLEQLSLPREGVPLLVCFPSADCGSFYSLPLPAGEDGPNLEVDGLPPVWQEVLTRVEQAADQGRDSAYLEMVPGLTYGCLVDSSLLEMVERLQQAASD